MSNSSSSAQSEADAAKQELSACEKEITQIKNLLRSLGPAADDDEQQQNQLAVYWTKV
jgi:transcription elongation GreA/GreB family factor